MDTKIIGLMAAFFYLAALVCITPDRGHTKTSIMGAHKTVTIARR